MYRPITFLKCSPYTFRSRTIELFAAAKQPLLGIQFLDVATNVIAVRIGEEISHFKEIRAN